MKYFYGAYGRSKSDVRFANGKESYDRGEKQKGSGNSRAQRAICLKYIDGICTKFSSILQEEQGGNSCKLFEDKVVATIDKVLEYNCITSTQHKINSINFNLL